MAEITPRFSLAVFICGLLLLSANFAFPIGDSPEKPVSIKENKAQSFFVGFYLDAAPTINLEEISPASCSDANDGSITINVTGGTVPYSYEWTGPGNFFSKNEDINNIAPGTYTIKVSDASDEETLASFDVGFKDNIAPEVITQNISVQLNENGQASITADQIDNGSNDACGIQSTSLDLASFDCTNIGANTVRLSVTDNNGNTTTETATVTVEDNIKPEVITQNISVQLNENGQASITADQIDNGSNDACGIQSTSLDLASFDCTNIGANTVRLSITDNNGNTATETATVTVEDNIMPVPPILEDITWGCEYTVEAPIAEDNCDTEIIGLTEKTTFSEPGEHSIIWSFTDSAGNISTSTQKITINPIEIQVEKTDVLCNGFATGEVTATASGGLAPYTYSWGSLGTGATKTDLPAGTYSVTVTDANGCETEALEVIIEEPDTFIELTDVNTTSGCYQQDNGTATVEAQGGTGNYTYLWGDGQITQTATNLAPGKHTVTITDENGCERTREVTVSAPSELLITGFRTTETTSYGSATGTATAQISGGTPDYTFKWSDGQTEQTARDLLAGIYSVTVTDENGCSATEEVTIIDALDADIIPTSVCEDEDNLIRTSYFEVDNLTAVGGTAPYTYEWDFGKASSPATATGPGTHKVEYSEIGDKMISVTVTDINGLTFTENIIQYVGGCFADDCGSMDLEADDYFIGDINGDEITTENCADDQQKFLYVNVPSSPNRYSLYIEYIYSVENIETGELENFKEVGCFYEQEDIPDLAQTIPINYTCGDIVKIEGIYFTFSNNDKWNCGEGPEPKCYSTNNEATVRSPLYAVAFPDELLCNGSSNGEIFIRASGGTTPYEYSIDGGNTFQTEDTFNQLPAGEYAVQVRDSEGLLYDLNTEILEPSDPLIVVETSKTDVTCYGGEDGSATVEASGGTSNESGDPYIYVWDNGQTTATVNNLAAGEYNVRVLDANGCEVEITVIIEEPAELLANAGPDQVLECGNTSTFLEAVFNPEIIEGEPEKIGEWAIVNGPEGGSFRDINDPNTLFTGVQGTYTLRWTVPCGTHDDVKISFTNCSTLDFDGVDDYIDLGNNYNLPSNFTLEAWIKQDVNASTGNKTILSKRDLFHYNSNGFDLVIENNTPKFKWDGSSITSTFSIDTERWYHIAVISNSDKTSIYIDGIDVTPDNATKATPTNNDFPFLIGATYNSENQLVPENYFHGWIEEVRIWNKALSEEQLRFLMNQRLEINSNPLRGTVLPMDIPGVLGWSNLDGYYQLFANEAENGFTKDKAAQKVDGQLRNIKTLQQNTAPLPYISANNSMWRKDQTWLRPDVWDPPNSDGVNGDPINWNIAKISHNISSGSDDIYLLGLLSEENMLTMANEEETNNENNSGQGLTISHYLRLNGNIDLVGESQLIQTEGSILEEASSGYVERDQQGTENSYNYNYWTSPVSVQGSDNNSGYTIKGIMKDGTSSKSPQGISFAYAHTHADGNYSGNKRISTYWLHKFHGTANSYGEWKWIGANGNLKTAEGFTMKGTSGAAAISDNQNYVFRGKPNNGTITLSISNRENRLVGNPYPSALDSKQFILDNLDKNDVSGATNTKNVFNGALYFWDHFGQENSHILREYVGGYATINLSGTVESASSVDKRINNDGSSGSKKPGMFIPVAQGFFVNSVLDESLSGDYSIDGGDITFRNKQRVFVPEGNGNDSQFLKPEYPEKGKTKVAQAKSTKDTRYKIRLNFHSPKGYHRQILVTADSKTTNQFDLGYDAPLIDNNVEDMFWIVEKSQFVIQGVPHFNLDQRLPLGIKIAEEKEFSIEIGELENLPDIVNIYLRNNSDSTHHDLRKEAFKATLPAGEYQDLYEIVFHDATSTKETKEPSEGPIDYFYSMNERKFILSNPELHEINHINIYNIAGQLVDQHQGIPDVKEVHIPQKKILSAAVYIVKVYTSAGEFAKKVIIRKD